MKTPELDLRDNPFRNYAMNGDMAIMQRPWGARLVSPSGVTYITDRYKINKSLATATQTFSQDTDVPTFAQAGYLFKYSLRANLTTPQASIAAGEYAGLEHCLPGFSVLPLINKVVTVSFWVKAALTGVYCLDVHNNVGNQNCITDYTINAANTWEYKAITLPALPSTGWQINSVLGMTVRWVLAMGATYRGAANNVWGTSSLYSTNNQVNGVQSGATDFRITGIMINEGNVAAPFRLQATTGAEELSLCRKYYEKGYQEWTKYISAASQGNYFWIPFTVQKINAPVAKFYKTHVNIWDPAFANIFTDRQGNQSIAGSIGLAAANGFSISTANLIAFPNCFPATYWEADADY